MLRLALATVLAITACKQAPPGEARGAAGAGSGSAPAATPPVMPTGTIAGAPFAPTAVMLLESSDGGKLAFFQQPADRLTRKRCEEPMGSGSEKELSLYRKLAEWQVGAAIESSIDDWGTGGVDTAGKHPGTVRVTLREKNAASFRLSGTIEAASDDGAWKFAGSFEGDYCPTKIVSRGDDAALGDARWTKAAVDPAALATAPVAAVIAGAPSPIAHATWREVSRYVGGKAVRRQELLLFAAAPSDPCAARPMTGDVAPIDTIAVWSVAAPVAGARVAGRQSGDTAQVDQVSEADVSVYEPDGTRHWLYSQYFTAALAIETVDDKQVTGRVFVALPDQGKTMASGAFTAVRCPPLE